MAGSPRTPTSARPADGRATAQDGVGAEVRPRDGLQIQAPVTAVRKLELLQTLVATGVPRIEATAFVSAKAVPSLTDAAEVAVALGGFPELQWSALVASASGTRRSVAAGVRDLESVVSVMDGHSLANARRSSDDAVAEAAAVAVAELVHDTSGTYEAIIAVAWDCPYDTTSDARTATVAAGAVPLGADQVCLGDTIGTPSPARVLELVESGRRVARIHCS